MIAASGGNKCNCGGLCNTVRVFVGVEQELGHLSCACHWSLHWDIAIIKACILPSTTIVSDCWRYKVRLSNDGLTRNSLSRSVSFVAHGCSQIRSRPHGCSSRLTSGLMRKQSYMCDKWIQGVPISWVWWCFRMTCKVMCLVYYYSVGPYIPFIFLFGYFPDILKITKIQTIFKKDRVASNVPIVAMNWRDVITIYW